MRVVNDGLPQIHESPNCVEKFIRPGRIVLAIGQGVKWQ